MLDPAPWTVVDRRRGRQRPVVLAVDTELEVGRAEAMPRSAGRVFTLTYRSPSLVPGHTCRLDGRPPTPRQVNAVAEQPERR